MAREKLVEHYAPPRVDESYTHGLTPSVLAGSGSIEELMITFESSSHGFILETDYMDDPRRPGAVLGPKTVPKRTEQLLGGLDEEVLYNTHVDLPREYTVRVNQDFMTLFTLGMGGGNMKRALFISVLMLFLLIPTNVEAQGAPIGVEVDCDQSTININVHPEQNEPVSVPCTVKNTGSFAQDISLESGGGRK